MLLSDFVPFLLFWPLGFLLIWWVRVPRRGETTSAPPSVSVIIPARNEAANLPALLTALTAQQPPPHDIIVVDDHSSDATATVATAHGARVVAADALPPGWLGKPWACWQGAQAAEGELLLFLDADTRLTADGLGNLVDSWRERRGLLSVQPYHRIGGGYEQLAGFFNLISAAASGAFGLFAEWARQGAFGQCNLCARSDYLAVGGHSRSAGAIVESLPLAAAFREAGHAVTCMAGEGAVEFRMYPGGCADLLAGFGRSAGPGLRALNAVSALLVVGWLTAGGEAARHLLQAAIGGGPVLAWLGAYLLFAGQVHVMWRRLGAFRLTTALLYPIPLAVFAFVVLRSVWATRRAGGVSWKGRRIQT